MNKEKKERSSWGWSIPDDLLEIKELDMYEKVLIAIMGRLGALEKPIYPRHKWLAEKMGMSESGVSKVIKRLTDKEIIIKEGKRWKVNLYSITYPSGRLSPTYQVDDSPTHQVGDKKDIQSKDIQRYNIPKGILAKQGFAVNELISLFQSINPSYKNFYKNTTQRKALERLVTEHGLDGVAEIIKVLPKTNLEQYAPMITTPLELENNLAKLLFFLGRSRNNKKTIQSL